MSFQIKKFELFIRTISSIIMIAIAKTEAVPACLRQDYFAPDAPEKLCVDNLLLSVPSVLLSLYFHQLIMWCYAV